MRWDMGRKVCAELCAERTCALWMRNQLTLTSNCSLDSRRLLLLGAHHRALLRLHLRRLSLWCVPPYSLSSHSYTYLLLHVLPKRRFIPLMLSRLHRCQHLHRSRIAHKQPLARPRPSRPPGPRTPVSMGAERKGSPCWYVISCLHYVVSRGVLPISLLLSSVLLNARLKAMANQHPTGVMGGYEDPEADAAEAPPPRR